MEFNELRKKYTKFVYEKYVVEDTANLIKFSFFYTIDGLSNFITTWEIAKVNDVIYDKKKVYELAFMLGLIESLSIWKITCSKDFYVSCSSLSERQISWFKKILKKGMGEFFYRNNIDIEKIADEIVDIHTNVTNLTNSKGNTRITLVFEDSSTLSPDKVLIPIGGGKDSVVSIELLKDLDRYVFIVNPRKATTDTFEKSGLTQDKLIVAKRTFDSKIVEYNKQGFLNGHTPFSALISFASVLTAYINGISYVALSNESSANESTVKGADINHQYSKTYEYEKDFIDYEKENIDTGVKYFSFLRPLTEVGIAKIFSRFDKYHKIFRSCNVGSKEDMWCGVCAKCLFVYIILSPFMERNKLIEIFGKDLLDDESLKQIFDKLIGVVPEKPFECVGSRDEVKASLDFLVDKYVGDANTPTLLKYYKTLEIESDKKLLNLCLSFDNKNSLPNGFDKFIKKYLSE